MRKDEERIAKLERQLDELRSELTELVQRVNKLERAQGNVPYWRHIP